MKKHFYTMLLLVCMLQAKAQDPHFSQFFEAPLLRNPSLAGLFAGDIRVQGVYRSQWGSVTVPITVYIIEVSAIAVNTGWADLGLSKKVEGYH